MDNSKSTRQASPNVLFVTSEIAPWVKTGGLGDISGALPQALAADGLNVRILTPAYPAMLEAFPNAPVVAQFDGLGGAFALSALRIAKLKDRLHLLLLDCPEYFNREGGPYQDEEGQDWPDNAMRFGLLSRIAAHLAGSDSPLTDFRPDILHLNDWQSALAPAYLHFIPHGYSASTVLTIHNLAFQGNFPTGALDGLGLPPHALRFDAIEHWGLVSFLKAGLQYANQITTVSPTYAREIQGEALGFGLAGILQWRSANLTGILNGIDSTVWNPALDSHIAKKYGSKKMTGKRICRQALRTELALTEADVPLFGMVTRLTYQKGADLVLDIADQLVGLPAQIALLGSGDKPIERGFIELQERYPGQVATVIGFNEGLAHRIEAGADIFLMPSRFEPCGLNQMYSLAYGTIPLVTATGGLADTVVDTTPETLEKGTANGFVIDPADGHDAASVLATAKRATEAWNNKQLWQSLQRNGMACNFGWAKAAAEYRAVYSRAMKSTAG